MSPPGTVDQVVVARSGQVPYGPLRSSKKTGSRDSSGSTSSHRPPSLSRVRRVSTLTPVWFEQRLPFNPQMVFPREVTEGPVRRQEQTTKEETKEEFVKRPGGDSCDGS